MEDKNQQNVSSENKLLAAISYIIWIVSLVIILTDMKNNEFMRHHGWQALAWGLTWLVIWIGFSIISSIPIIGWIIGFLGGPLLLLFWFILSIIYAIKASRGDMFKIPVVYGFVAKYIAGE